MKINGFYTLYAFLVCFSQSYIFSMPHNFRLMHDPKLHKKENGLEKLNASGSAQISLKHAQEIRTRVAMPVIIVDLRKEWHSEPITDYIAWCKQPSTVAASCLHRQSKVSPVFDIRYTWIPVPDGDLPTDGQIDQFIELLESIKDKKVWLHIHCLAGKGRTTTFLILYDIFMNASSVSAATILQRQAAMGGYNSAASKRRVKLFSRFHAFILDRQKGFKGTWSAWSKTH